MEKDIKSELHESIENIDDIDFLVAIKQIVARKYESSPEPKLTQWQLDRINDSKSQIEHGAGISNERADELVAKWLNG